jgi:hypothetical protein
MLSAAKHLTRISFAALSTTVVDALPVGLKALGYDLQSPPSWAQQAMKVAFVRNSRGVYADGNGSSGELQL